MTDTHSPPPQPPETLWQNWGFYAVLAGALGLAAVFLHISLQFNTPQPSAAQQVGEIAGEMRRAAWRGFLGLEQEPAPAAAAVPWWQAHFPLVGPILGIIAVVLGLISALRREDRRFVTYSLGLGTSAIVFQAFWWVLVLVLGVILLISVIQNMDGIFGG